MSKLIIVCGLPGSGKTTLAKELSKQLNIACLHKDALKENLYEILKLSTLEDSKRIGNQSVQLLLRLAEEQIANKADLIIEAPFTFQEDYTLFQNWIDQYKIDLYSVICNISAEERKDRFVNRPRHSSHHDQERIESATFNEDTEVYNTIPGKQIKVTTDQPVGILAKKVAGQIVE